MSLAGGVDDPGQGISVGTLAATGDPFDALVDLALRLGLETRFDIPAANTDETEVAALLRDPRTVIGLGDAGAHTNQQCDASYATYLLGHWVRELGVLSLEEAVWRLTGQPASVYGFGAGDRPAPGGGRPTWWPSTPGSGGRAAGAQDLPGGASTSGASGVATVWVAGTEIVRQGRYTGATPGQLLRRSPVAA